jgi:hypothetical protein
VRAELLVFCAARIGGLSIQTRKLKEIITGGVLCGH